MRSGQEQETFPRTASLDSGIESPSYYRLGYDLAEYRYPTRLGIQKVELDPDSNREFMTVDDQVEVLVTIANVSYKVFVLSPGAAMLSQRASVLPRNTVFVPQITGQAVAQAVVLIVERGLGNPRVDNGLEGALEFLLGEDYDEAIDPRGSPPSLDELSLALEARGIEQPGMEAFHLLALWPPTRRQEDGEEFKDSVTRLMARRGIQLTRWNLRTLPGHLLRELRSRPTLRPVEIVEILLYRELPVTLQQHHLLAAEIHDLWRSQMHRFAAVPG